MSVTAPVSTQDQFAAEAAAAAEQASVDERWNAWKARGAAHDRVVRGRMMILLPSLAAIAIVIYLLLR